MNLTEILIVMMGLITAVLVVVTLKGYEKDKVIKRLRVTNDSLASDNKFILNEDQVLLQEKDALINMLESARTSMQALVSSSEQLSQALLDAQTEIDETKRIINDDREELIKLQDEMMKLKESNFDLKNKNRYLMSISVDIRKKLMKKENAELAKRVKAAKSGIKKKVDVKKPIKKSKKAKR